MSIETLIYAYLAICTSMIVFNCVSIFYFRQRDHRLEGRRNELEQLIWKEFERIRRGEPVTEGHKEILRKKLMYTEHLLAFDGTLSRLMEQEEAMVRTYLQEIHEVFNYLALSNRYRSTVKRTYFAHVIQKYRILENAFSPMLIGMMMDLLEEPSLYCRESAMWALYSTGRVEYVMKGLHTVDAYERFYHGKLLTDGLLSFRGDHGELAKALWEEFESFSIPMQVILLDYIRFSGAQMPQRVLELLADDRRDDEIRFSCIRYFGKNPYDDAFSILIFFLEHPGERRWEYAAISATALASYPGERTVEALKGALRNPNWYVRFNAAKSLESFDLPYVEISDIMEGRDRYAREIMQYQLDMARAKEKQEERAK